MGRKFGTLAIAISLLLSCGKTEKVEGIKGPQGDKGERGDKGDRGEQGLPAPIPTPSPLAPDQGNINGNKLPPIIIINPGQDCNKLNCPIGTIMVCACIDGRYQTISLEQRDLHKVRIRNYGRCEDYGRNLNANDCIFWPRQEPRPTITAAPIPIPAPTVTVTSYPIPYPTVTVYPQPRPNEC